MNQSNAGIGSRESDVPEGTPQVDGSFLSMLQNYNDGQCISDLSAEARKVVEAVMMTGKPGSVSLKLTFKPASSGAAAALVITDSVTSKLPKVHERNGIFFVDPDMNLHRDNPKQMKLALKVVDVHAAPMSEAKDVTAEVPMKVVAG
jgi:hypothetical protein